MQSLSLSLSLWISRLLPWSWIPSLRHQPHKDGPAYYERVCIVSLISTLCINFYRSIPLKNNNAECPADLQIVLEPRSCLIFQDDLYRIFHTIHECSYDIIDPNVANLTLLRNDSVKIGDKLMRSGKRISLTIRHVYTCDIIKSIDSALYFLRTSNLWASWSAPTNTLCASAIANINKLFQGGNPWSAALFWKIESCLQVWTLEVLE